MRGDAAEVPGQIIPRGPSKMDLDVMLRAGSSHPRVEAREEQDPIWDPGRASCLPTVGEGGEGRAESGNDWGRGWCKVYMTAEWRSEVGNGNA